MMRTDEWATRRDFVRALAATAAALVASVSGLAADSRSIRTSSRSPSTTGPVGSDDSPRAGQAGHWTGWRTTEHPDPRPDVDGSNVLTADDLSGNPDLIPVFEGIARIPHIADGIGCACGCASDPNIRSLLSCYEKSSRMALFCEICQAEGRMTIRLHEQGRTLEQIRAALDARFG